MMKRDYYEEMIDKYNEIAERIAVLRPESWSNEFGPKDWWAVCDEERERFHKHGGIVAYFFNEEDAISFRHEYIKGIISGLKK